MSQILNSTFTINWGSEEAESETESITLSPQQRHENGTYSLYELDTTMPLINQANYPLNLKLHNSHAYNIALLDCQWNSKWITGIESFVFDGVDAKNYTPLPSYDSYYGTHFLEYLLKLQETYEKGDGYRLSRLFDKIWVGCAGGSAHSYDKSGASDRQLGLDKWDIQGRGYYRVHEAIEYENVEVPETSFFVPSLSSEEYKSSTGDAKNIFHPSSWNPDAKMLYESLHFIIPQHNSFTLLVIPRYYCDMKYGYSEDYWGNESWEQIFRINVLAFTFNYKIFDNKVFVLKNVEFTRYAYTHPVPFQILGNSVRYHDELSSPLALFPIESEYKAYFKLNHVAHVVTARWNSKKSITVLDTINKIEQIEFNNQSKIMQNDKHKQIYTNSSKIVSPFRNVGRVTTQYTLSDPHSRTPTISPSIKQIEKLVLRPENYLESDTETCFSLDGDANINITSQKLVIKRIILNGLLTISED